MKKIDEILKVPSLVIWFQNSHYNNGAVECVDYIHQQLGSHYPGYLEGNVIKCP